MLSSKDTAIYVSAHIQVSQQLEDEARPLLGPPTTLVLLNNISQSQMDYVTVKGWVTADEMRGQDGTLERGCVLTPVCVGSPVEISHVRGKNSLTVIKPGTGVHEVKPKGYRTIDSDNIPHIVPSAV
ncbi:unnamed protein product [Oreochromis niloticus]|nr:unnamed protein product [Mustela putorius furo]